MFAGGVAITINNEEIYRTGAVHCKVYLVSERFVDKYTEEDKYVLFAHKEEGRLNF